MAKYAKWIGGGLGWAFAGPIGGIVGWVVGAIMDYGGNKSLDGNTPEDSMAEQGEYRFAGSLLVMTAAVMRADGKTTKDELDHVKKFLLENFGEEKARAYLLTLRDVIKAEFSITDAADEIKQYLSHPARLQLMHFLYGLAFSDGLFDQNEEQVIARIGRQLGISTEDLLSIRALFGSRQKDWYAVLEIEATATNDEVKKAFRRMSIKYHPDKVHSMGDAAVRGAEEKFRQLNEAYENIKRERGII